MPIYEFYCSDCHTVFSFLSRAPDTERRPACPRCDRPRLERKISRFAVSRGRSEAEGEDGLPADFDEERVERVMAGMAHELDGVDENDPVRMAGMMRKLFDSAGLPLGPAMDEAIRRMEAGEDPDRIEEEMGDRFDGEDEALFGSGSVGLKRLRHRLSPPAVDDTLYEM